MFDTVWAAALALHNTAAKLPSGQSLLDFDYSNANLSKLIYQEALSISFFGLTVSNCVVYNLFILSMILGKCLLQEQWRQTRKDTTTSV